MSKVTGSAQNILILLEQAQLKVLDGEESPGTGACFAILIKKLNEDDFKGASGYDLRIQQLQKTIYYTAKKLVKQGKGHLGLTFISPYLNRLSQFVYQKSFEHLKTVNGIVYERYQQACLAMGLLQDDEEWVQCFKESIIFATGKALRILFATAVLYASVVDPQAL